MGMWEERGAEGACFLGLEDGRSALKESSVGKTVDFASASQGLK